MKTIRWTILLSLVCVALHAEDLSQFKTADELWQHIEKLQEGPATKPESREQAEQFMHEMLNNIDAAAAEFEKQYPADARRWEAELLRLEVKFMTAQMRGTEPDYEAALKTLQRISDAPDVSAYVKRKARAMTREVQGQLATAVQLKDLKAKPLELKFQAVDGTEVNLAKLRGKVVLIDFWATWCGPCLREIPNVVATYGKLHEKGFEIVGISLDQNKERLLNFTKEKGMTWPQYFDGKVWQNEISTRFGIRGIPAMWLVDRKGYVRHTNARGANLAEEVEKLLNE